MEIKIQSIHFDATDQGVHRKEGRQVGKII